MTESDNEWIELNHPIDADVAKVPFLPRPSFKRIEDASLQATDVTIATHVGTHLEAPRHLDPEGATIDAYPPSTFISRGLVAGVRPDPLEEIDVEDIELASNPKPGDALLLSTGWEAFVGDDRYYEQPYLSEALAHWIVESGFAWVGIDSPSPEMPVQLRDEGFDYPVHTTLLEHDVLIAEHLTTLEPLVGEVLDVIALPVRYIDSDGAQARIVARIQ